MEKDGRLVLTPRDLIDVVIHYNIFNSDSMPSDLFGLCDEEKGFIFLNETKRIDSRRRTAIHEIYHALAFMKYLENTEKVTRLVERNTYRNWYGKR